MHSTRLSIIFLSNLLSLFEKLPGKFCSGYASFFVFDQFVLDSQGYKRCRSEPLEQGVPKPVSKVNESYYFKRKVHLQFWPQRKNREWARGISLHFFLRDDPGRETR